MYFASLNPVQACTSTPKSALHYKHTLHVLEHLRISVGKHGLEQALASS